MKDVVGGIVGVVFLGYSAFIVGKAVQWVWHNRKECGPDRWLPPELVGKLKRAGGFG